LRRLLQRLPFTATLGEALLAERLRTALERASAFVLAHEAAARDIGRYRHDFMPLRPSIRLQLHATACQAAIIFLYSQVTKLSVKPSAARYELLQEMDEDDDEGLDTSAMSQKEAARESATRQVLDESARVSACGQLPLHMQACIAMPVQGIAKQCGMNAIHAGDHMQGCELHLHRWPAPVDAHMQGGKQSVSADSACHSIQGGVRLQQFPGLIAMSSPQERAAAEGFMAGVRQAYPEVAVSVRTTQLAHRLLARKAAFVDELGRSGALLNGSCRWRKPLLSGFRALRVCPWPAASRPAEA
jgi:hypothetical protein